MTKQYANKFGYSDVVPFEVVRVISDKTLEIRRMAVERDTSVELKFNVGGFLAHCSNQHEQKWIIASDTENPIFRIRKTKSGWKDSGKGMYDISDEPVAFYDYNF